MGKQTPFYDCHMQGNAKIVDFAGWDMPLHYGSQLNEHHVVRKHCGMFDVSHMGVVDVKGHAVKAYLSILLANNVAKLVPGKALYSCMLNEQGGVIDDLIVYQINDAEYRIVVNAGTREKDLSWMREQAKPFAIEIIERADLAILALQGPESSNVLPYFLSTSSYDALTALKPFHFTEVEGCFFAKTGYTGEAGFEIILPADKTSKLWQQLLQAGVSPCGLGARDTLRLEAGLNLYGADMTEATSPLVSNLAWTVALDPPERDFIGKKALAAEAEKGVTEKLVGLVLEGPGIIRNHLKVTDEAGNAGEVTSGGYAPSLEKSIALARVAVDMNENCVVHIRNKPVAARIIKPPFVRNGKKMF